MYQYVLVVSLLLNMLLQYECEIKSSNIKHQAILMPFDQAEYKDIKHKDTIPIHIKNIKNYSNINAKKIHITIWLKRNNQVKL